MTAALYYTAVEIRKNAWKPQTDREQRIQLQRPLLSPVDCWGERANSIGRIFSIQHLYIISLYQLKEALEII